MKKIVLLILMSALLLAPVSYAETASPITTETAVQTTEIQSTQASPEKSPVLVPVDGGRVALYIGIAAAVAAAGCGLYFYLRKLSVK